MREQTGALIGLKDQPIEDRDQEALGLDEYADVLTEFIQGCDTPMTIALQGDWGSGKTSLMKLIRKDLNSDKRYLTVWFNTWQYAQFNMEDTLALSMMSKITDTLALETGTETLKKLKHSLWSASRAVAIGGASLVGQGDTAKEMANEWERGGGGSGADDPAITLERIKEGLAKVVKERTAGETQKVVVFIDDLDRLVPKRAVELLEAMKVFLDIDRCVYVIACDYSVVAAGLKDKFGLSEAQLKGKSFFDKIIQVPFKMPTRQYQVHKYIEQLLRRIGVEPDGERDVEKYRELVEHSVGFNPRTMKRLLNMLQLLTILKAKRQARGEGSRTDPSHACRVTFAILCMLERYEAIYDFLTAEKLTAKRLADLQGGLRDGKEFEEVRIKIAGRAKTGNGGGQVIDSESVRSASEFVDKFVDCLKKDDDDAELSDEQIWHLEEMLSMSALVSAGRQLHEFVPRQFALQLRWDLNVRYASFVGGSNPKYDKFRMEQGTVYLYLSDRSWWLLMGRENETYYFDVRSPGNADVPKLGSLICKRLNWDEGTHWKNDAGYGYRFFAQSAKAPRALDDYQTELFRRLDQLTAQREFLVQMCAQVSDD